MRPRFLFLIPVFWGLTASAGGFDGGPQGARLLGLGGASTAYLSSIASLSTNPGLLPQWGDSLTRLSFGGMALVRRASFVGQNSFQRTNQDLTGQPGGYFYATRAVSPRFTLGLALTTPYGYHTQWPDGWEGRSVVQESQLSTFFAQPTVGIKLNDNFSAGLGLVYAFGRYSQRRALGQYDDAAAQTSFRASGAGVGLNAGLYGRTGDNLSFGISYRSGVRLNLNNGTARNAGIPTRDAALYPASASFRTRFNLPGVLSVGVADRITKNLLLTFDFALSGWSTLDSLNLEVAANGALPAQRQRSARRYEDALAFRVGAEYRASPRLTLLGGLHYDETPVRDEYINPEFIDANRLGASAGVSYQLNARFALEAGYSFDYGQLRTARVNTFNAATPNIGGTYRLATQQASLGLAAAF